MASYKTNIKGNFPKIGFLDTYLDGTKGFIAGGCFKNFLLGQRIKDIDIFFTCAVDYKEAVDAYRNRDGWAFVYENEKCISFSDGVMRVELIRSIFGTPEAVLRQFDFTIVKFAYYREDNEDFGTSRFYAIYHEDFFEHLQMKRLVLDENIPFPISTYERTYRYGKYGYFPCRESKIRLLEAIRAVEWSADDDNNGLYGAGWD